MIGVVYLVIFATLLSAYGVYLLKKATLDERFKIRLFFVNKTVMGGLSMHGISSLIFIYALTGSQLTILYPLFSLNYIWVMLFSWKKLGESINHHKILGVLFIILGIILINI